MDPNWAEHCAVRGGVLMLEGGVGDFSACSAVWRRLQVPDEGFVARARLRGWPQDEPNHAGVGLELVEGVPSRRQGSRCTSR